MIAPLYCETAEEYMRKEAGTLNYADWCKNNPKAPRNVLVFFDAAGIPIPDLPLIDLRAQARQHLQVLQENGALEKRGILRDLFGPGEDGKTLRLKDIIHKWRTSPSTIKKAEQEVIELLRGHSRRGPASQLLYRERVGGSRSQLLLEALD